MSVVVQRQPDDEMTGAEMAAAVLLTLEEDQAANVLRHMDEKAIALISDAIASPRPITAETSHRLFLTLIRDLEHAGALVGRGFSHFRKLLITALGEKRASDMIERIMQTSANSIDVLSNADPRMLADQLRDERPQMLAVLVGHMSRQIAADFLAALPEETASEVIFRHAQIDTIQPFAMTHMKEMLNDILGGQVITKATNVGGVRPTADLLNGIGSTAADKVLEKIRSVDPDLADAIRESMFTFDDLGRLTDAGIQMLLSNIDLARLTPALRGTSQAVRDRIYRNMATKEAAILREDVETGPAVTRTESQNAKRDIISTALRLAQDGQLALSGTDDMV